MSNHCVACPICDMSNHCVCVCFLAGNYESVLCTVGQLYYVSEIQFYVSKIVFWFVKMSLTYNNFMANNKLWCLLKYPAIVSMETCFHCHRGETGVDISSNRILIVLFSENTFDRKIFWTLVVLSGSSYLFTLKSTCNNIFAMQ